MYFPEMRLVGPGRGGGGGLQVYIKDGIITYILGNKLSFSMRTAIVLILIKILNIFLLFSVLENYFYRAYQTSSPISDKPNSNLCDFFLKYYFENDTKHTHHIFAKTFLGNYFICVLCF